MNLDNETIQWQRFFKGCAAGKWSKGLLERANEQKLKDPRCVRYADKQERILDQIKLYHSICKSCQDTLKGNQLNKHIMPLAVVVAQLAERSLPTPEIRGSNPNIGNISNVFFCQLLSRKDKNKEKEAGKGPLKKHIMPFRRDSN